MVGCLDFLAPVCAQHQRLLSRVHLLPNLSFLDLCLTTSCVPQGLVSPWGPKKAILFLGCSVQLSTLLFRGPPVRLPDGATSDLRVALSPSCTSPVLGPWASGGSGPGAICSPPAFLPPPQGGGVLCDVPALT